MDKGPHPQQPLKFVLAYLACVLFSVGGTIAAKKGGIDPGPIAAVVGPLTLLTGVVAIFATAERSTEKLPVVGLIAACLLATSAEFCSLKTGIPFGHYAYTNVWRPAPIVAGVHFPLVLPLAWALVAGGAFLLVRRRISSLVWAAVAAAGLSAAIDAVLEPDLAIRLGYWTWLDHGPLPGGAPIANAVGWFAVSFVFALILGWSGWKSSRAAAPVLGLHVAMVALLGWISGVSF